MHPARYEVIARPFRRAGGEDRGLEFGKARRDHPFPDGGNDLTPQRDVAVHAIAPKIQIPVAQARLLGILRIAVHLQRQRVGRRLHRQIGHGELDLAGGQLGVHRFRSPGHDVAGEGGDRLQTKPRGQGEVGAAGIEDTLSDTGVVAKVQEQEVAVIALAMHPPGEAGGEPHVLGAELAARVRAVAMHRSAYGVSTAEPSGRISDSPKIRYPLTPWLARSSSCLRSRLFRDSTETRCPWARRRCAATITSGRLSRSASKISARRRAGDPAPSLSCSMAAMRSNPMEKPQAGTSRPRMRPIRWS